MFSKHIYTIFPSCMFYSESVPRLFAVVPSGCGGVITASQGVVISPGYDVVPYPNYQICRWNISEPDGMSLQLKFEGFMMRDGVDSVEVLLFLPCHVTNPYG